ncbi:monosaccharide ABC transporter ATP-binding protein (CUT2 family) [Serpentinicella alkaliphila]|uniref:Monosaccharide ABC transporter ATP-binding protein (CUT2 family) n=1 Tax=Serpentinicella alkaliphila TaxID=1734049 RepID=A0A4R2TVS2_9FIRM|nr:monosaccharide ABC transporter ATP-binding protein (CUT2 family) [Serpentinicella alkaliphila]
MATSIFRTSFVKGGKSLATEYLLQMKDVSKEYSGNRVLKGVNINIKAGEIHGLVGENGAGKSTLMNILFGMPVIHSTGGFGGDILIDGKIANPKSPRESMELGIGMVHQEFMLIPGFSITENIKLNREITKENLFSRILGPKMKTLDLKKMGQDSREALDKLGMSIDEWLPVAGLPVGYMQFIEIAREIDKDNLKLLVFDEPTAVLAESEADRFLKVVRKLSDMGIAILFISHRLDEIIEITDNITVLRDGEVVCNLATKDADVHKIAELMVGRKIENTNMDKTFIEETEDEDCILNIKDLYVDMPGEMVKGLNLNVRRGEILGIGGLGGQGKIGVANGIMGLYPTKGEILKDGKPLPLNQPRKALDSGVAFVTEDRRGVGLLLDDSIEHNIAISALQIKEKFLNKIVGIKMMDEKAVREHALSMIQELDIRCTGPKQLTRRLSGGNQQKVCIARALTLDPDIILVSEPTRGIDIGAKKIVLDLLVKLNKELGMTVIITSSELAELRSISDRIAIVFEGKLEGILAPNASDVDFGLMMAGEYGKEEVS